MQAYLLLNWSPFALPMHFFESKSVEHGVFENWKTTFSNSSVIGVVVLDGVVLPGLKIGHFTIGVSILDFDLLSDLSIA